MKIINFLLLLLLGTQNTFAAKIIQHKDKKILIDLEDSTAAVDQKFFLLNADKKKVAIATITQVKNKRAIALITKGTATGTEEIQFIESKPAPLSEDAESPTTTLPVVYHSDGMRVSAVITMGMNSMTTKQTDGTNPVPNSEDVSLKGTSIGITGTLDYPMGELFSFRGTLGYEPFKVAGTAQFLSCDSLTSTDCNAMINYISAGGYLRFDITKSRSLFWVAGGATVKHPLSKSSTALLVDDIKTTTTFAVATGLDFFITSKSFIPISAEYQMFQSSDTVSANLILLRAGYGWTF